MASTRKALSNTMGWDKNNPESMELYIRALEADYVSLESRSKILMHDQDRVIDNLIQMWRKVPAIFKFWI